MSTYTLPTMLPPLRQKGLAHIQAVLASQSLADDTTSAMLEKRAHEDATEGGCGDARRYRSCVREVAGGYRSRAQSPLAAGPRRMKEVKALPKCRRCKSNESVVFKLEQRRRADEGMTPVYTCRACNVFWTG